MVFMVNAVKPVKGQPFASPAARIHLAANKLGFDERPMTPSRRYDIDGLNVRIPATSAVELWPMRNALADSLKLFSGKGCVETPNLVDDAILAHRPDLITTVRLGGIGALINTAIGLSGRVTDLRTVLRRVMTHFEAGYKVRLLLSAQ